MTSNDKSSVVVAGFNACSQLAKDHCNDIPTFTANHSIGDGRILYTSWSTTVYVHSKGVKSLGSQNLDHDFERHDLSEHQFHNAFGDHNGMFGCLGNHGVLLVVQPLPLYTTQTNDDKQPSNLVLASTDDSPRFGHIACAGNGRVSLTFRQAPNGNLCHIADFKDIQHFLNWHNDPTDETNQPDKHHMIAGRSKILQATALNFVILTDDGAVHTWGDPRHGTLGRGISGYDDGPSDTPGLVHALGGLEIVKIECGSWISGALSRDSALYLWGTNMPGSDSAIKCLTGISPGEVVLVDINTDDESEPIDVVDFAIGDYHIAVLSVDGRTFVVGSNKNGQLGLGNDRLFLTDWEECKGLGEAQSVACPPNATFISF